MRVISSYKLFFSHIDFSKEIRSAGLGILLVLLSFNDLSAQNNSLGGKVILPARLHPKVGRLFSYEDRTPSRIDIEDIHVVLYPLSFEPQWSPQPKAIITQKGEQFIPQVLMITPGSTVYFLNEDNQYHNVFSRSSGAIFNIGRRPPGHVYPKRITRTGTIKIFCDIHAHMRAYVLSVETPYYGRLNQQGEYYLDDLPDGEYRVEVTHPNLDPFSTEIELNGGEELIRNWDLSNSN